MNTLLIVLTLVIVGVLVYKFWKPMIQPPKREVKPNEANLYFFYTNWCGFSKKAMPEWEKLKDDLYFGKTHINPIAVDCETDQTTCSLYNVEGYPSVVLETKTGLTEMKKQVTHANLLSFLRESLGEERQDL
jgi:thiol-disulfide isomerase/thioredoxin